MTDKEQKIFTWINSVGCIGFTKEMIEYLVNDCHMEEIREYYCNDNVNFAIEGFGDKSINWAFSELWSLSKNMNLWSFIVGFGISDIKLDVLKSSICKEFNTLEKLRKVNYEQLVVCGIEEIVAKSFIKSLKFHTDEMNVVLDTNRVTIK